MTGVYACGLQVNERSVKTGEYNNLILVSKDKISLLDVILGDRLTIAEIAKASTAGEKKRSGPIVPYFDLYCGLLYVLWGETGDLAIFEYKHCMEGLVGPEESRQRYTHDVALIYEGTLALRGQGVSISGLVEGCDRNGTRIRVIVSDSEGIKFAKVTVKQSFPRVDDRTLGITTRPRIPSIEEPTVPENAAKASPANVADPLAALGISKEAPASVPAPTQVLTAEPQQKQEPASLPANDNEEDYEDLKEAVEESKTEVKLEELMGMTLAPAVAVAPTEESRPPIEAPNDVFAKLMGMAELPVQAPVSAPEPAFHPAQAYFELKQPPVPEPIQELARRPEPMAQAQTSEPREIVSTCEVGVGSEQPPAEPESVDPETLRAAVKETVSEGIHSQFERAVIPAIESAFKVRLCYNETA